MCLTHWVNKLMGRKVNPRDFLLNTDYEMDKIVYFNEGSIAASEQTKTIQHKLGFTPLIFGICSTSSNFSNCRSIPYLYQLQDNYVQFEAKANGNSIVITYNDFGDQSSRMYYRIYAFEPSNSAASVAPTSKYATQFVLNTDYNYCKLCKKGILTNTVGTHTVPHNLGYIPQVLAWGKNNGYIFPIESSYPDDPVFNEPHYVAVTDSNIIVRDNDGTNPSVVGQTWDEVHYRIYYDEA